MLTDRYDPNMSLNSSVLFLTSWYPTPENPTHGIFIRNHAKALALYTKVVVVYAYSTNQKTLNEIEIKTTGNLTELILPYPKTNSNIPILKQIIQSKAFSKAYQTLLKYLIEHSCSISAIQLNVIFPMAIALPIFNAHFKSIYTIVEHWSGYLPEDGNYKGAILKSFTKQAVQKASKIWVISEKQKQSMIAHGLTGNYELIYNAVNTSIFKITNAEKNKKTTFLHVSSLVEREKNLTGTFNALKKIQNKGLDFDLIIVGGNNDSITQTKQIQKQIGLTNVSYKGHQSPEKISELMNQCHALLLFSHFEGMPVVALEAMACGLPVFASEVGHLPQMISNDFGKLANTVEEFERHLENFILGNYSFNSEAMQQFIFNHASYEAVGKQLFDFYKTV